MKQLPNSDWPFYRCSARHNRCVALLCASCDKLIIGKNSASYFGNSFHARSLGEKYEGYHAGNHAGKFLKNYRKTSS